MCEAFRGIFELAKILDTVSEKHQTNVNLGHLSNHTYPT